LTYLERFGFGQILEHRRAERYRFNSIEYVLGLSQRLENITSLQLLQLVSLIARRGEASVWLDHKLRQNLNIKDVQLSEHTWNVLQEGMKYACRNGTAKGLDPENKLRLAVKTGTTQEGNKFQSWLAGYFPYDSPRYVFCLRAHSGTSYEEAVPLAHNFLFGQNWL